MKERSTGDLLLLMFSATVCLTVLFTGAAVFVINVTQPESDTSAAVKAVGGIINTLLGLAAGFLAGRSDRGGERRE